MEGFKIENDAEFKQNIQNAFDDFEKTLKEIPHTDDERVLQYSVLFGMQLLFLYYECEENVEEKKKKKEELESRLQKIKGTIEKNPDTQVVYGDTDSIMFVVNKK